jgi:iron complex transport system ATP-binding protein
LTVSPGEVVALVGPNGAGKSTLLRTLAGDEPATAGRVLLDGRPIESYRPRALARRRAVLPQQTVIQFAFTAREVVEMGRSPHGGDEEADAAIVRRSLEETDAAHLGERIYPSLSVGEQSRVSLARVLAQTAPILLLDEPTAALDLRHQEMVIGLCRRIANTGGTVVIILHDLNLAAGFADRVVLLCDGRVVADGPPAATMTEALLTEVFACPIAVVPHPVRDGPLVLPLPQPFA